VAGKSKTFTALPGLVNTAHIVRANTDIGRLIADADGWIREFKDGTGEIGRIHQSDILLTLAGIGPGERLELSISGQSVQVLAQGPLYVVLAKQVKGMIRDWPKKRAALWRVQ
jgi:hypothetical protein